MKAPAKPQNTASDTNRHGVLAAYEILIEEIEGVIEGVNAEGAAAFAAGRHTDAGEYLKNAQGLTAHRTKVRNLQREWEAQYPATVTEPTQEKAAEKAFLGRLSKGIRTPESDFRISLLKALDSVGGSGKVKDLWPLLEKRFKGMLRPADLETLASSPTSIRWKNTVQWCRLALVEEGLMKADSKYGVWEISDKGREYLVDQTP